MKTANKRGPRILAALRDSGGHWSKASGVTISIPDGLFSQKQVYDDSHLIGTSDKWATLLLQFGFSKAFDTISPFKLLTKLQLLEFPRSAFSSSGRICPADLSVFSLKRHHLHIVK